MKIGQSGTVFFSPFCGELQLVSRLFNGLHALVMAHFKNLAAIDGVNVVTGLQSSLFSATVRFHFANFDGQALIFAANDDKSPRDVTIGPFDDHVDDFLRHVEPRAARNRLRDKLGTKDKKLHNVNRKDTVEKQTDEGPPR